jgi:hypothetical protein
LMGWMFRVSLGTSCWLETTERPSILDFLFKMTSGPAEAWSREVGSSRPQATKMQQSLLIYL